MTNDHGTPRSHLSRRQLLKAGGLTLGALAVGRRAAAQTPKPGGTLVSAQATGSVAGSARSWVWVGASAKSLGLPPLLTRAGGGCSGVR